MLSEPIQHIVLYHFTNEDDAAALITFYDEIRERTKRYVLDTKAGGRVKPVESLFGLFLMVVCGYSSKESKAEDCGFYY
jgi:hypothetical protein